MTVRILTLFDDEPLEPSVAGTKKPPQPKKNVVATKSAPIATNQTIQETQVQKQTIEPKQNNAAQEKNYYSIGETANKFKVRTSHIRFWTTQFGLKVRTTRKGDRLYTPENIDQLKLIHHLVKEQGFTIAGAKAKLKELRNAKPEELQKIKIVDTLKTLQNTLINLRNQIELL